jgi:hypothetical protein
VKLILTAPISGELAHPDDFSKRQEIATREVHNRDVSVVFNSRASYNEHELGQDWHQFPDPPSPQSNVLVSRLERLYRVTCNKQSTYVAIVEATDFLSEGGDVVIAEEIITNYMKELVNLVSPGEGNDIPWSEKWVWVDQESKIPTTWFDDEQVRWKARSSVFGTPDCIGLASWGMSALIGTPAEEDLRLILMGQIDALTIWTEMERISQRAETIVHRLTATRQRSLSGDLNDAIDTLEDLSKDMIFHHLLLNDIYLRIPGLRHVSALNALAGWKYQFSVDRIDALIAKTELLTNQKKARSQNRMDRFLSWVLFALAAVGILQIVLGLVSAAFIGVPDDAPAESTDLRLLAVLRDVDIDSLLVFSGLFILLLIGGAVAFNYSNVRRRRNSPV